RFDEPVCNTSIMLLLKSWRTCTIDRFEPSVEASARSVEDAVESAFSALWAELLSRKSVPARSVDRPRPAVLKVAPVMLSVDLPVSLNTSFSVSPFRRLTPLKEESCEVVLICASTLLYCATRLARVACEFGSATGPWAVRRKKASPLEAAAEPVMEPI